MTTRHERHLRALRRHQNDASPEVVEAALKAFDFVLDRQRGSHKVYRHVETGLKFTYPYRRPVRRHYVQALIALLEELGQEKDLS